MRKRKAVDTWVQVLTGAVGIVIVAGVAAFLTFSGSAQAADLLSLFIGIGVGAGLGVATLHRVGFRNPVMVLLLLGLAVVIAIPILFERVPTGGFYFGIAVGFVAMRLTHFLQKRSR